MSEEHHHHHHHKHHQDDAERFKQHALHSKRMRKIYAKVLYTTLWVIAILLVAFIVFVSLKDNYSSQL